MCYGEIIETIKNLVTIGAGCIAGYVGLAGLSAWKKKLKGKSEYDLARRYLTAVYKLRDALKDARSPIKSINEIHSDYVNEPIARTFIKEFMPRWKIISDAILSLNVEVFEAEVLWGWQAREIIQPLIFCSSKLYISAKIKADENRHDQDAVVFASFDEHDELSREIKATTTLIENYIKPHLK
jgi:hypothetical protein